MLFNATSFDKMKYTKRMQRINCLFNLQCIYRIYCLCPLSNGNSIFHAQFISFCKTEAKLFSFLKYQILIRLALKKCINCIDQLFSFLWSILVVTFCATTLRIFRILFCFSFIFLTFSKNLSVILFKNLFQRDCCRLVGTVFSRLFRSAFAFCLNVGHIVPVFPLYIIETAPRGDNLSIDVLFLHFRIA